MKGSKCASVAQEIGFSAPNSSTLPWLVQRAIELCNSKNECNRLDLTEAQYFSLVDIMIGQGGLLLVVPHVHGVPVSVLLVGLLENKS